MVKNSLGMEGVYSPDQPTFERNHNLTNLTGKQMAVTRLEEEESQNNIYGRIANREECAGSRSVGKLQKGWIDTMKDCLKK